MGARAHWGTRLGFVLAAAGSAIGLGNIWKFPYITGVNGGGLFVLIYLGCVALVGIPVLLAEVLLGRAAQSSPVGAFRTLASRRSPWVGVGWLGVAAAVIILSYYSVVAGWTLHYVGLAVSGRFAGVSEAEVRSWFSELHARGDYNLLWHAVVMGLTTATVAGGVKRGVEIAARVLMPLLFLMMLVLLIYASTLKGFGEALSFVFAPHTEQLSAAGVLEALGHSFFTLSVGMGAMLTYGSYLSREDNLVASAISVGVLDTVVGLAACAILFSITFTFGMKASAGPGLVFINLPVAFSQLPLGNLWAGMFFLLLAFAALTSAISLLEVACAYLVDERGWTRHRAALLAGSVIFLAGVPSALSGGTGWASRGVFGRSWFDAFDYTASNWLLPAGGLGIALFTSWRMGGEARRVAFESGSRLGRAAWFYTGWLVLLRYVVPLAILLVALRAIGVLR
ncbi:MAG: sodium-dependent transporter [Myxococcales bacterium]